MPLSMRRTLRSLEVGALMGRSIARAGVLFLKNAGISGTDKVVVGLAKRSLPALEDYRLSS